jgi:hypothetical protein
MIDKDDTTKKSLNSHTSFEDYKNDVGKLKKMAEHIAFTIIYQAIRYNRRGIQKSNLVICLHPIWKEAEEIFR